MSTITKERVAEIIHAAGLEPCDYEAVFDSIKTGEIVAMARIALASLEAEAVAWDYERASCITSEGPQGFKRVIEHEYPPEWAIEEGRARKIVPLFTAPPAQVSVPAAMEMDDDFDSAFEHGKAVGWNAYRAAMLHGAEPVSQPYRLPFEQWLSQQTGTIDVECGCVMTEVFFHWLRVAYEAGNSPVIPDGWVACSERMPGHSKTFLALTAFGEYWTGYFDRTGVFWCDETKVENVTHWMPLPAAPQQE